MANQNTSRREYDKKSRAVRGLLERIGTALERHGAAFKQEPGNWSFVGDLGHVEQKLTEIERFCLSAELVEPEPADRAGAR